MKASLANGWKTGLATTWTLGKVIFPVTLLVGILRHTPVLDWIVQLIAPLMGLIGLRGEAAIPLVLGNFLNLYAGIAGILTLDLSVKEVFILAVMLSFSHNLIIESTVAAKVGIKLWLILIVRVGLAIISAAVINLFWRGGSEMAQYGFISKSQTQPNGWGEILLDSIGKGVIGILQLAAIVIPLMIIMQFMKDLGWLKVFSKWMAPVTRFLGMRENTSMTLVAGLTIGLAYGAGVMIQAVKEDGVSYRDLTLAFIFLVSCHAVVEDTLIFVPLGIPVLPLFLIRVITAVLLTIIIAKLWKQPDSSARKEPVHEKEYHSV
ncbi:nucleoside recognition domain-containing protein [Metabacillus sp. KIGAM252]|uniref:Nucleoside recognition domain-containing protein n=1 Tax=Metabacillus flavus TaxID=2823519 RepID=A0ABS5LJP5_9BACI|nr:nucleoside recognition domain-containing protein [Metabacillus flavus]MBS2970579.1 nucleoside recognition domain-containing protein [Metabacillus flavus]